MTTDPLKDDHEGGPHLLRLPDGEVIDGSTSPDPAALASKVEPWLSAMFQSEHLSVLLGNGFTIGVAAGCQTAPPSMAAHVFTSRHADRVASAAAESAKQLGRGTANLEDSLRAANQLREGAHVLGETELESAWTEELGIALRNLVAQVLATEGGIRDAYEKLDGVEGSGGVEDVLGPFLLSFASRSSARERLSIFTTNYDRLIEMGCERMGLRVLDRFVGTLEPVFRSSRLDIDVHYNPPGIRGEPRYLEGVVKLTKLHGSIDWSFAGDRVRRVPLPFGAPPGHPGLPARPQDHLAVFPMAAKDVETSSFPYSELFRDFSAAICRPNSVLVCYGYGFGDSHVNSAIRDMLTIPSTHLVIISFDDAGGRIPRFIAGSGHAAQLSLLLGPHFGDLATLTKHYLPKPAIDLITFRRAQLMRNRFGAKEAPFGAPANEGAGES